MTKRRFGVAFFMRVLQENVRLHLANLVGWLLQTRRKIDIQRKDEANPGAGSLGEKDCLLSRRSAQSAQQRVLVICHGLMMGHAGDRTHAAGCLPRANSAWSRACKARRAEPGMARVWSRARPCCAFPPASHEVRTFAFYISN